MADIARIQKLAASGATRKHIAAQVGLSLSRVNVLLRKGGIRTTGADKPLDELRSVHGCGGEPPAKLMPSPDALRAVFVFGLAHA